MPRLPDNVIILNRTPEDWSNLFRKWFRSGGLFILLLVLVFFALVGNPFFTVGQSEIAIVQRFGKFARSVGPGLGYKLPWPIETVKMVDVQRVRRLEVGFRSRDTGNAWAGTLEPGKQRELHDDEALMLTGDENIVRVELEVQYRIIDPVAYEFRVVEPENALNDIVEATLRRVIGDYGVDSALTEGKAAIEDEIKQISQELSDEYGIGAEIQTVNLVEVHPPESVRPAFNAVISAKEEKQKIINEAQGYRNGQIPKAEGEAAALINEASAYSQERVLRAKGEVERFSALLAEYHQAEKVTKERLYLEAVEEVLSSLPMTVIDRSLSEDLLPHLDVGISPTDETPIQIQGGVTP
jgi:membrane protease subunit HflK